jgi:hypothetical protein
MAWLPWRRRRSDEPARRRRWPLLAFGAAAAALGTLLDPHAGWNPTTLLEFLGIAAGLACVVAVVSTAPASYRRRRFGHASRVRALPLGLAVAVVCVVISRVAHFQPGYLYGIVVGVVYADRLQPAEDGRLALQAKCWALVVCVAAWAARSPVATRAAAPHASWALRLVDTVLATLFVAGLEATTLGLLPLRHFDGDRIRRWHPLAWAVVTTLSVLTLFTLLLHPRPGLGAHSVALWTWFAGFAGFGLVSVLFWLRFERRPSNAAGP